ncbi:CGG triplet repeat-binding protein 1 [Folsomia candida]|uniref:CGG triplet repeat-binding protein 1 n=1 Tax=Folsomia candida TaxID=158441 RepID=A0A226E9I8_FOLCA|nr:CGG triplet repeat-binding protein 1 [Folsomia candida]
MGKQKTDHKSLHAGWIQDLKVSNIIKIDGAKLVSLACQSNFTFKQKSQLEQHIKTSKHENLAKKFAMDPQRQILLSEAVESQSNKPFYKNMCRAFISAGIPWKKLQNPVLQNFLQTYTGRAIPDESTLRKNYLPQIYAEAIEEIRRDVGTNPIWLSVDETTDACGRYIANVLIGSLKKDEPSKSHLICSKQLEKTNNATVTKLVLDSLQMLWPGCKQDQIEAKFLLFITDGVQYMLKAGKNLKVIYTKLLHVTCLAHGVNRVAEQIRSLFPDVDKFVANMKTAFKKAPSKIAIYKEKCPDLPLPPNPVITRWGTWLKATEFYGQHFNEMKDIIETINNDAASTLQYLDEIENKLLKVNGNIGKAVIEKFRTVIGKNPDLEKLKQISSILEGESDEELNPAEVAAFNYAPLTSVETERSFSMHKFLLSDRRQKITPENLEMELVSRYESLTED